MDGETVVFGRTFLFHPPDARDVVLEWVERAVSTGVGRDEILFHLSRQHIRWHRQGHVGAAKVSIGMPEGDPPGGAARAAPLGAVVAGHRAGGRRVCGGRERVPDRARQRGDATRTPSVPPCGRTPSCWATACFPAAGRAASSPPAWRRRWRCIGPGGPGR